MCVGVPAAYAFARFPFTGRTFLFFALLVMRMLPPIAVLVPMYVLFSKLGLATTRFSVVLAYTTFSLPLVVWIMRGFFEDLPEELEESAWIDGASRYRAFWHIVLPLARPGMVAASILCLQLAWNDFLFAAVLTNNATQTLPVMMAAFSGGRFRRGLGRHDGIRRAGDPAGDHFLLHRAEHLVAGLVVRRRQGLKANEQQSTRGERQWPELNRRNVLFGAAAGRRHARGRARRRGRRPSRRSWSISARTRAAGSEP